MVFSFTDFSATGADAVTNAFSQEMNLLIQLLNSLCITLIRIDLKPYKMFSVEADPYEKCNFFSSSFRYIHAKRINLGTRHFTIHLH